MFGLIEMLATIAKTTRKFIGKLMKCLCLCFMCLMLMLHDVCAAKGCKTISSKVAYTSVRTTRLSIPLSCSLPLPILNSTHFALYALHAGCNLAALICKLSCCAKRRAGKQVLGCSFCHPSVLSPYPTPLPLPCLACGDSPSNCRSCCHYQASAHLYYNSSQTMRNACVCVCVCRSFQNFMRSRKCTSNFICEMCFNCYSLCRFN